MKLSELKTQLSNLESLNFKLEDGKSVEPHFHLTEIGLNTRHFIDCGGTERIEKKINFQFWVADDVDHRLSVEKLRKIISLGETKLGLGDLEIEVEYQGNTIQKFHLAFENGSFVLVSTKTDCLAKDACGVPEQKPRVKLSDLNQDNCCAPSSGCC